MSVVARSLWQLDKPGYHPAASNGSNCIAIEELIEFFDWVLLQPNALKIKRFGPIWNVVHRCGVLDSASEEFKEIEEGPDC